MEKEAVEAAHQAFIVLEIARAKAATHDQSEELTCKRPSVFWFQEPADASSSPGEKGETVEAILYGKGQTTLERASMTQPMQTKPRKSKYTKLEEEAQHTESIVEPKDMDAAGSGADAHKVSFQGPIEQRPRLDTEGSYHFPSLLKLNNELESKGSDLRSRGNGVSFRSSLAQATPKSPHPWDLVKRLAIETERGASESADLSIHHVVSDGVWHPFWHPKRVCTEFWKQTCSMFVWTAESSDLATDLMARDSTFAVVTFTSRQAAIAARHALADGRGAGRWISIDDLPVPPLADASAFNICDCRGCCRPVTVTLNDHQKACKFVCVVTISVLARLTSLLSYRAKLPVRLHAVRTRIEATIDA